MATRYNKLLLIKTEDELENICSQMAKNISTNLILGLNGDMGTGKTTFVRYLSASLGSKDWVNSPTYSIVQSYLTNNFNILHVDLYRCNSDHEIDQLDLLSQIDDKTILIIEWFSKTTLFNPDLVLNFEVENGFHKINFSSETISWIQSLNNANS